jgi:hypothetical protein
MPMVGFLTKQYFETCLVRRQGGRGDCGDEAVARPKVSTCGSEGGGSEA